MAQSSGARAAPDQCVEATIPREAIRDNTIKQEPLATNSGTSTAVARLSWAYNFKVFSLVWQLLVLLSFHSSDCQPMSARLQHAHCCGIDLEPDRAALKQHLRALTPFVSFVSSESQAFLAEAHAQDRCELPRECQAPGTLPPQRLDDQRSKG